MGPLREIRIYTQALTSAEVVATRLATDDPDSDGWINAFEYLAGSDPLDAGSIPAAPGIVHVPLSSPHVVPAPRPLTATVTGAAPATKTILWWRRNADMWNFARLTASNGSYVGDITAPGWTLINSSIESKQ